MGNVYKQYKNSKLCKGFNPEYKPCEYIDTCTMCTNYVFDTRQGNNNELYRVFGIAIACKRDNPDFEPWEIKDVPKDVTEEQLNEYIRLGIVK